MSSGLDELVVTFKFLTSGVPVIHIQLLDISRWKEVPVVVGIDSATQPYTCSDGLPSNVPSLASFELLTLSIRVGVNQHHETTRKLQTF